MKQISNTVGRLFASIIEADMKKSEHDDELPAIRVRSLEPAEIAPMIEALEGFRLSVGQGPICIRIGSEHLLPGLEDYCLEPGRTLTSYRNSNTNGLVLVEVESYPDSQGLVHLLTVDDESVFGDSSSQEECDLRVNRIIEIVWESNQRKLASIPSSLVARITELFRHNWQRKIALRQWISFVCSVVEGLAPLPPYESDAVDRVIGDSLASLDLFRDPALFDALHVNRRLSENENARRRLSPSGSEVSEEDLLALIQAVDLSVTALESWSLPPEPDEVRELLRKTALTFSFECRSRVTLDLWLLLFEGKQATLPLGAAIRKHLEESNSQRVGEFDNLDIQSALDVNDQDAADTLLKAPPAEGQLPLVDLLPAKMRRRLEKLAYPSSVSESDPLRALLKGINNFTTDTNEGSLILELESRQEDSSPLSRWLFALLYGCTLKDIAESSQDGVGWKLSVDSRLLELGTFDSGRANDSDQEAFDVRSLWPSLRISLRCADNSLAPYRFQWRPIENRGLIALAAVIQGAPNPPMVVQSESVEGWCDQFLDPRLWPVAVPEADFSGPLAREWATLARGFGSRAITEGLSVELLDGFLDAWERILLRARVDLVPNNSPLPDLEELLDLDIVRLPSGRLVMLGSHPLRLRWLQNHLRNVRRFILKALESGLVLNEVNDGLFFDSLSRLSPHRQPPVISGRDQVLAISVQEFGYHEVYAPIQQGGTERKDWLSAVDEASIETLAHIVRSYLEAYPHKQDGLALLLILRDGDASLVTELVKRVRQREFAHSRLEIHVVAPQKLHGRMASAMELVSAGGTFGGERFLPDVQLLLHDWHTLDCDPDLSTLRDRIDIAIAPNLFGAKTTTQPSTRFEADSRAGHFNPWMDATSYDSQILSTETSENVSRILLPVEPDPMLEAWSTLSVRRFRNAPVALENAKSADYLSLQVQFHAGSNLFMALHDVAHWVITLDPFIGRDQIDALSDRPDVILVKAGVGKNRTYTAVVSSRSGQRFVTQRLKTKLDHSMRLQLPAPSSDVAQRVYEVARNTFPGVILKSLGVGRSTEELLGLLLSRYAVEQHYPAVLRTRGLEWWLSLDEVTNWFGGANQTRADLLRVVADLEEKRARLSLHVVESKFRPKEDLGLADAQLKRSTSLLSKALANEADDLSFWLREFTTALEQTSKRSVPREDFPALRVVGDRAGIITKLRTCLNGGEYDVVEVRGIAVAIAYEEPGSASTGSSPEGFDILRLRKRAVEGIIDDLVLRRSPSPGQQEHNPMVSSCTVAQKAEKETIQGVTVVGPENAATAVEEETSHNIQRPDVSSVTNETEASSHPKGMGPALLAERYQVLLNVLDELKVSVSKPVEGALTLEGPGFYLLRVQPSPGTSVDKILNRVEDIKLRLYLEASQSIRAYTDKGAVVFEIPKSDSERYPVYADELWAKTYWPAGLYAPFGEDLRGNVVGIDFSSADSPHLLIGGATGSGKSVLLETLIREMVRHYDASHLRLTLVDPKGTELQQFENLPHIAEPIGMHAGDAIEALQSAVNEMQIRYDLLRQARVRSLSEYNQCLIEDQEPLPWWVIVLDEYADLTSDPADKSEIEALLKRLAQKARAAGIHVVVATQKPSAEVISTTIRSNLPAQVALRVKTASDSRIIMDEVGAETLSGKGDAFFKTARGVVRFQCALARPS